MLVKQAAKLLIEKQSDLERKCWNGQSDQGDSTVSGKVTDSRIGREVTVTAQIKKLYWPVFHMESLQCGPYSISETIILPSGSAFNTKGIKRATEKQLLVILAVVKKS